MVGPYRNVSFATAESFDAVLRQGSAVTVRGEKTLELRNRVTTIERPCERCVFLPGRNADIFHQIAETLWVIGGRNDLPWLTRYLTKAPDFSDDGGKTWRGAYGPRLRRWQNRIDQLDEWRRLLVADPMSRRVVGVIFDPQLDFVDSRDIPCNNWISWLIRDNKLHLNIAIRSNDAMWGFSGINAFEFSVLHEMLAFWLNVTVGDMTFLATSYHLYERHYERARSVVQRFYGVTPYDFGVAVPAFGTSWGDFRDRIEDWFDAEAAVSNDPNVELADRPATRDPLLASGLRLVRLKWGALQWTPERLKRELSSLPEDDFAAAAYEYFGRRSSAFLQDISQPRIAAFFQACSADAVRDQTLLKSAISTLHERKNASYGDSWKRRGERVSILPNVARKIDRLRVFAEESQAMAGESVLDTAVDLWVYLAKYQLFLTERPNADTSLLPPNAPQPASDHNENFERVLSMAEFCASAANATEVIANLDSRFETLWRAADADVPIGERQRRVGELRREAEILIGLLGESDPHSLGSFIAAERTHRSG